VLKIGWCAGSQACRPGTSQSFHMFELRCAVTTSFVGRRELGVAPRWCPGRELPRRDLPRYGTAWQGASGHGLTRRDRRGRLMRPRRTLRCTLPGGSRWRAAWGGITWRNAWRGAGVRLHEFRRRDANGRRKLRRVRARRNAHLAVRLLRTADRRWDRRDRGRRWSRGSARRSWLGSAECPGLGLREIRIVLGIMLTAGERRLERWVPRQYDRPNAGRLKGTLRAPLNFDDELGPSGKNFLTIEDCLVFFDKFRVYPRSVPASFIAQPAELTVVADLEVFARHHHVVGEGLIRVIRASDCARLILRNFDLAPDFRADNHLKDYQHDDKTCA